MGQMGGMGGGMGMMGAGRMMGPMGSGGRMMGPQGMGAIQGGPGQGQFGMSRMPGQMINRPGRFIRILLLTQANYRIVIFLQYFIVLL